MSAAVQDKAAAAAPPPHELVRQAAAVALHVERLRAEIEFLQQSASRAQAAEALTRADLTEAVLEALGREAAARGRLRSLVRELWFDGGAGRPPAFGRITWRLRGLLARMGWPGEAALVAGSGMWRASGRPRRDLRELAAYLRRGADPAAAPASLFDQAAYLADNPDVAGRGRAPLAHYLLAGQMERRKPHLLFDPAWYERRYGEAIAASRLWPLAHFVRVGAFAGCDPHPYFDMVHYASQGPQPAPGEDLPSHYLREGWRVGLSPHPLFDAAWYQAQAPESAGMAPLAHFIIYGAATGLSPHPLFDPAWYLQQAPDAVESGLDAMGHFLLVGAARGVSPSPWFDPRHYASRRGEALDEGANPLLDYLQGGAWSVAEPAPGFSTAAYVASHPELAGQGLTPLHHWARAAATDRRHCD